MLLWQPFKIRQETTTKKDDKSFLEGESYYLLGYKFDY